MRQDEFRSLMTEPEAIQLYGNFLEYYTKTTSQFFRPNETVVLMWEWAQSSFGEHISPTIGDFFRLLGKGGASVTDGRAHIYPALFDALARATRGLLPGQGGDRSANWQPATAPDSGRGEPFTKARTRSRTSRRRSSAGNVAADRPEPITRPNLSTGELDLDISDLEEQVRSLEMINRRLVEAVRLARLPSSEGGSNRRIDDLEQKVRSQEEKVERLQQAGKTVIEQREWWKTRAEAAEARLAEMPTSSDSGRFEQLRRVIAKELHPDFWPSDGLEKIVRQELFKQLWAKVEALR